MSFVTVVDNLPPILLAVPMREWTWTASSWAIKRLLLPARSRSVNTGGSPSDILTARNALAEVFLAPEARALGIDWVLWMDSDMLPAPDLGLRLVDRALTHDHIDILGVPACKRAAPWDVCVESLGSVPGIGAPGPVPAGGLLEVRAVGFGCVLVHRRVFEAMEQPYFSYPPRHSPLAENRSLLMGAGEDYHFCDNARALGFQVWCDYDCEIGHLAVVSVTARNGRCVLETPRSGGS